ncbi:MAG: nicotinamide mononucleotide transporter, partial [Clostridia bacterium]|nr:nicotinamide mononucleotide transporter [Clostridia bacterium]
MSFIKSIQNLTRTEKMIWAVSLLSILISSLLFPNPDPLSIATSLIGATALIFVGKGDPMGQLITVIFAVFYALVSLHLRYYGEMITYLGMTAPSAVWALVTWLKNPYSAREVKVAAMTAKKWLFLILGGIASTVVMYFVLDFFDTANLAVSTVSVTTSFMASMLTVLRSPYYALFYGANDIVLIILWVLACTVNIGYLPMVICFIIFLIND